MYRVTDSPPPLSFSPLYLLSSTLSSTPPPFPSSLPPSLPPSKLELLLVVTAAVKHGSALLMLKQSQLACLIDRQTDSPSKGQTCRQTDSLADRDKQTDLLTNRQTDRQTDRQIYSEMLIHSQTDRETGRHA